MSLIPFIEKVHNKAADRISSPKMQRGNRAQQVIGMLYSTMIELAGSYILLAKEKRQAGGETIFRSMIEAYVDIINLTNDESYVEYLAMRWHQDWNNLVKHSQAGNPFLAGLSLAQESIDLHKNEYDALKAKGRKILTVRDRFEMANMVAVYESIYAFSSRDAHNSFGALLDKHFDGNAKGAEYQLYKEREDDPAVEDALAGILIAASGRVHEYFKTGEEGVFKDLNRELGEIRKSY